MEGILVGSPLPPRISSLASYFPFKILDFETPSPLEFPMTFVGVGMDIFWNRTIHDVVLYFDITVCTCTVMTEFF